MSRPDIHADDYALTLNTSKDMLECMRAGKLDSISIVPNMLSFEPCMELLYGEIPHLPFLPCMSVHLDFVEGRSLAGAAAVPDLVKEGGRLGRSFSCLLSARKKEKDQAAVKTGNQSPA